MKDAQLPVQSAIRTNLLASAALTTAVGGTPKVYDLIPKEATVPFISLGEFVVIDGSTAGIDGQELTLTIHTWDEGHSSKRLKQMMAAVISAVHDVGLTLTDPTIKVVNVRFTSSEVLRDPDGVTAHGVQRFRIVTDES